MNHQEAVAFDRYALALCELPRRQSKEVFEFALGAPLEGGLEKKAIRDLGRVANSHGGFSSDSPHDIIVHDEDGLKVPVD